VSIETKPGFLYSKIKRKMRVVRLDKYGNEVAGRITFIADEVPLACYDVNNPDPYPGDRENSLDERDGEVTYIEGMSKIDLVTVYDVTDPAKLPSKCADSSEKTPLLGKN